MQFGILQLLHWTCIGISVALYSLTVHRGALSTCRLDEELSQRSPVFKCGLLHKRPRCRAAPDGKASSPTHSNIRQF
ncbi:hypothetical protein EDD16DRAFT_1588429 [Pisolithus croceorrhizus]|nr:hypothetical protein EDD16DRAFT_1588429 [Pisolithus croceorrhizus]KAI6125213.1 hypothetical protein EV401DRAFT_1939883 [Pisolithus croceorrhizus]